VEINHHYEVVDLSAAEQSTYLELFHILTNQPLKFTGKKTSKSTNSSDLNDELDRTKRLQDMASVSTSPEEALLVCCSTPLSTVNGVEAHDRTAKIVCKAILEEKKRHFSAEAHKLCRNLIQVFELWELGYTDTPTDNPHFYSFIRSVTNNVFGDMAAQEILDRVLGYAQANAKSIVSDTEINPSTARRFPVPVEEVCNKVPIADGKSVKERKTKRSAIEKATPVESVVKQSDTATPVESVAEQSGTAIPIKSVAEQSNVATPAKSVVGQSNTANSRKGPIAKDKGQTEQGQPDLRDLPTRKKFMIEIAAALTNLALHLVEHVRGLRFNNIIEGYVNGGNCPKCSKCGKKEKHKNEILIMGLCGHASCITCFEAQHAKRKLVDECVAEGCAAPCSRRSAFRLSNLNTATSHLLRPFGSKVDAVLKLLKDSNRVRKTEYVVIFVQFARLKTALIEGLKAASITYLDGSHKQAVERFKTGRATVCILDPESVNAAGW
jgi:hypothetical protein